MDLKIEKATIYSGSKGERAWERKNERKYKLSNFLGKSSQVESRHSGKD